MAPMQTPSTHLFVENGRGVSRKNIGAGANVTTNRPSPSTGRS